MKIVFFYIRGMQAVRINAHPAKCGATTDETIDANRQVARHRPIPFTTRTHRRMQVLVVEDPQEISAKMHDASVEPDVRPA